MQAVKVVVSAQVQRSKLLHDKPRFQALAFNWAELAPLHHGFIPLGQGAAAPGGGGIDIDEYLEVHIEQGTAGRCKPTLD